MLSIKTYEALDEVVRVFASGVYNLLVLIGDPGLAKPSTVHAAVEANGEKYVWLRNNVSAFHLYLHLPTHKDAKLLIIDDVDSFYADKGLVRLLKCICETEKEKTISWHTDAAKLDRNNIPRQFSVSMNVAIISNDLKRLNANVGALEDRGRVFRFEPDAHEIHKRAASFFQDHEIYQFIEEYLHLLNGKFSLRDYVTAAQEKIGGLDWRRMFLEEKAIPDHDNDHVLIRLLETPFETDQARYREFHRQTGLSRATYYRLKKSLRNVAA